MLGVSSKGGRQGAGTCRFSGWTGTELWPCPCRIGNLLVPNDNYCKFEDWLMPILDQMVAEQDTEV